VAQMINTVQKSGINKNIKYSNAFKITKTNKNLEEFISHFFLINRLARNITYASLKNSDGWMLGTCGIFNHHLAPL
jgi:hypothetical protein